MATPRALATIDLAAITANVKTLQARSRTQIMAVVKADAYGHGLVEVAKAAVAGGATWVGTALLEEGLALRAAGIECRVMSWLTTPDDRYDEAIAANIDLSASSIDGIKAIVAAAERLGKPARLHLEIDTGMTRGGVLGETPQSLDAIKQALKAGHIHFAGMWSHFARADEPVAC